MHHYRCYRVWSKETRHKQIANTLRWFPTKNLMSQSSTTDIILVGLKDTQAALQKQQSAQPLSYSLTDSHIAVLKGWVDAFEKQVEGEEPAAPPPDDINLSKPSPPPAVVPVEPLPLPDKQREQAEG